MKRVLTSVLAALTVFASSPLIERSAAVSLAAETVPQIRVDLDGYRLPMATEPINYKGRVMVPFRSIADAIGLHVQWDAKTSTVIAGNDKTTVKLQIGNQTAEVNGKPVTLDVGPIIDHDRALLPLRFLSEQVGGTVSWDGTQQVVSITSPPQHLHAMVFYGLGSYDKRAYLPRFDEATFAWSRLDASGHLVFNGSDYYWPTDGADELLSDVRQNKVASSLMVFSENKSGEVNKLLQDPALQGPFASALTDKVVASGLDSATLDLEAVGDPQKEDPATARVSYTAFVDTVAMALHAKGKQLHIVVAPLNGWYQGYDYRALAQSADQLYIMAYSYIDDAKPQPMDQVDEAIRQALEQVDPKKIMLGINAYSETPDTVQEKLGLAKRYHLGGVGFWILKVFDDSFVQSVDDSILLRPSDKA